MSVGKMLEELKIDIMIPYCFNCGSGPRTDGKKLFLIKSYAGEKNNDLHFCSNRCLRQVERADKISRPKLDPSSLLLYTIKTGNDNADSLQHTERTLRNLTKAIVRTSKKTVKAKYTHNEGALPREWR